MLYIALFVGLISIITYWIEISLAVDPSCHPSANGSSSDLNNFIASERSIALQGVLDNIGGIGAKAVGADPGLVIASPSKLNPDYFYTWTRDSALTVKMLVDEFIAGDASLRPQIEQYVAAQAILQTVANPSGDLTDGSGLGEPKFEVNSTAFTGPWGRPQRDGPALRATALIAYSRWLLANEGESTVSSKIWPIILNDLNYVGQYWNQTGFDLWEEVDGSSFFTIAVQHRALVEGQIFTQQIGKTCEACNQAPQVLCFLQDFWNGQYVTSNINDQSGRNGRDANSILGSIHTFDPDAACDDSTFQPCSSQALANHKAVIDSFRSAYDINSGIPEGRAVAVGRYTEDVYFGGNPWSVIRRVCSHVLQGLTYYRYLTTLAAAEQLYDALYQFRRAGVLVVDSTSLPFFRDLDPSIAIGNYSASSRVYCNITSAIQNYADDFVNVVRKYTPADGSLAEQLSRSDGNPLSAVDLTWSYASFLTAIARRSSIVPASWGASTASTPPATCSGTSVPGIYTPAPIDCTSNVSTVAVTFNVREPTIYGETVFVSGNIAELGNGNTSKGLELHAYRYTSSDPLWSGTAGSLPAGESFSYKYYKTGTDGVTVTFEGGEDRRYMVPEGCSRNVVQSDTWQQ
ncbi:MAG: hypothetical protein Q9186_000446 [Xanthomendoza sp. 1 TL-2023]